MKKLIMASITAVVVIVVLAGTLIPILDDATETEKTFTNEGYYFVNKIASSDADTHTLAWSSSTPTVITVDGENLDMTACGFNDSQSFSLFMSENNVLRARYANSTLGIDLMEIHGSTTSYSDADSSMTASITGGTATISMDGGSPVTITYSDAYVIASEKTDLVMKKMNSPAYVNDDSLIYGIGSTNLKNGNSSTYSILKISGTVENMTATVLYPTSGVTISNIVVDYTDIDKYDDLNEFVKVTFDATINSTTTECVYSFVVVPASVTVERSVHFTDGENAILNAIPVIVIVALLLAVVAMVIRSRMD